MCDRPGHTGPRWGRLYALLVTVGVIVALLESSGLPARLVSRLEILVGALTVTATVGWLRASRAALDQREWCRCAGATLTVREITVGRLARRSRSPATDRRSRRAERLVGLARR